MVHLNGNLLCAVDVETTGFTPGFHDLIQVALVPLNSDIKPLKTVSPFYMNFRPLRPENIDWKAIKVAKVEFVDLVNNSIDPYRGADMVEEWFERLNLPVTPSHHKRIMPLWSNGGFDKSFILEWLGKSTYDHVFHFHERDTQSLALSINDRFYQHGEQIPFPKVGLNSLAARLGVINDNAHDALSDCVTTAEVYRRMLSMWVPTTPGDRSVGGGSDSPGCDSDC